MQTKGSLLFAEGPPTGFAISFFLGLLRRIQTPNRVFKVGVLCNEYDRVCVPPGEALGVRRGRRYNRKRAERGRRGPEPMWIARPRSPSRAGCPDERRRSGVSARLRPRPPRAHGAPGLPLSQAPPAECGRPWGNPPCTMQSRHEASQRHQTQAVLSAARFNQNRGVFSS